MIDKKKYIAPVIILMVILVNFFLGFPRLSRYSAVDEPYWTYDRISQFWTAISKHKWKSTNINDKPGITAAIISGPGLWSIDPMKIKSLRDDPKDQDLINRFVKVNFSFRLPLYLFALLGVGLFFYFLKKLIGEKEALAGTVLVGLSPLILGISLIINPDSLLWIFLPLSIISYLLLQKTQEKKYVVVAGIFLGLSVLTKYVANILYVYFFALIYLEYVLGDDKKRNSRGHLKKSYINYGYVVLISLAVFGLLFPATWLSPEMILKGTFLSVAFEPIWKPFVAALTVLVLDTFLFKSPIQAYILDLIRKYKKSIVKIFLSVMLAIMVFSFANTLFGMRFFNFEAILASPKSGDDFTLTIARFSENFFAGFYALIFGLTPLSLGLFLCTAILAFREKLSGEKMKIVTALGTFIVLYYTGSSISGVGATIRYQIALFPLALIISALGVPEMLEILKKEKPKFFGFRHFEYAACGILAIISVWSLVSVRPYFFSYASSLLPPKYILNLKDMGDGSFEAAEYLNTLPDASSLTIWSDKGAVCETFAGRCITGFSRKKVKGVPFDYLVVSTGRKSRSMKMPPTMSNQYDFEKLYSSQEQAAYKIIFDGREENFVKVVKAEDIRLQK